MIQRALNVSLRLGGGRQVSTIFSRVTHGKTVHLGNRVQDVQTCRWKRSIVLDRRAQRVDASVDLAVARPSLPCRVGAMVSGRVWLLWRHQSACLVAPDELWCHRIDLVVVGRASLLEEFVLLRCPIVVHVMTWLVSPRCCSTEAIVGESVRHLHHWVATRDVITGILSVELIVLARVVPSAHDKLSKVLRDQFLVLSLLAVWMEQIAPWVQKELVVWHVLPLSAHVSLAHRLDRSWFWRCKSVQRVEGIGYIDLTWSFSLEELLRIFALNNGLWRLQLLAVLAVFLAQVHVEQACFGTIRSVVWEIGLVDTALGVGSHLFLVRRHLTLGNPAWHSQLVVIDQVNIEELLHFLRVTLPWLDWWVYNIFFVFTSHTFLQWRITSVGILGSCRLNCLTNFHCLLGCPVERIIAFLTVSVLKWCLLDLFLSVQCLVCIVWFVPIVSSRLHVITRHRLSVHSSKRIGRWLRRCDLYSADAFETSHCLGHIILAHLLEIGIIIVDNLRLLERGRIPDAHLDILVHIFDGWNILIAQHTARFVVLSVEPRILPISEVLHCDLGIAWDSVR